MEYWIGVATAFSSVFLAFTTTLFIPLQDAIFELVVTITFEVYALTVWGISEISLVFAIICIVGSLAAVVVREWWLRILQRRKQRRLDGKQMDDRYLKATFEGAPSPSKPDTYLSDPHIGREIEKTAVFESKFKPMKGGDISDKYKTAPGSASKVHPGENIALYGGDGAAGAGNGLDQGPSFGGVNIHQVHSNSGVVVANYDDQAPMPVSVKKYGGGGDFGVSRNLKMLPPLDARPDGQMRMGSTEVAAHIANLEKNITANLEEIIKSSMAGNKSSNQQRRKAAKRRRLRVQGATNEDATGAMDMGDAPMNSSRADIPLSARRSRKKREETDGPGLSARGESSERKKSDLIDASSPSLDFAGSGRAGSGEAGEEAIESNPMLGKFASTGPGARLKPVPLGEEFISRKEKKKIKPDVTTQFPDWH
jgi:hypothetical protein